MSYGGWGNFFTENAMQMAAIVALRYVGPFQSYPSLLTGPIVAIGTDVATQGFLALNADRVVTQVGIGALSGGAIDMTASFTGM
jgi:hypothetical protein